MIVGMLHPFKPLVNFISTNKVSQERWTEWNKRGRPTHIQDEFPELSPGEREFLISGLPEDEFDELFREE